VKTPTPFDCRWHGRSAFNLGAVSRDEGFVIVFGQLFPCVPLLLEAQAWVRTAEEELLGADHFVGQLPASGPANCPARESMSAVTLPSAERTTPLSPLHSVWSGGATTCSFSYLGQRDKDAPVRTAVTTSWMAWVVIAAASGLMMNASWEAESIVL